MSVSENEQPHRVTFDKLGVKRPVYQAEHMEKKPPQKTEKPINEVETVTKTVNEEKTKGVGDLALHT